MEAKIKLKVGNIIFEAAGSEEIVEKERNFFAETLLPKAVEALSLLNVPQTNQKRILSDDSDQPLTQETDSIQRDKPELMSNFDFTRANLSSYLKKYGSLCDQDFVLFAAYFQEEKEGISSFSSNNALEYFAEARRAKPSNCSAILNRLASKGYIMDDPNATKRSPKQYILTSEGLEYIRNYQPKERKAEKNKGARPAKAQKKTVSKYSHLSADDLNIHSYPPIKDLGSFKEQMLLVLYIVTNEKKGSSFTTDDVIYLMTDVLGIPATTDQINGVFKRYRSWFKKSPDENNKKAYGRVPLVGAKEFAETIIAGKTTPSS